MWFIKTMANNQKTNDEFIYPQIIKTNDYYTTTTTTSNRNKIFQQQQQQQQNLKIQGAGKTNKIIIN
jgi:hypothetical protein